MCGSVTGIYKTITILLSVLIKVKKSHIMRINSENSTIPVFRKQ